MPLLPDLIYHIGAQTRSYSTHLARDWTVSSCGSVSASEYGSFSLIRLVIQELGKWRLNNGATMRQYCLRTALS